MAAKSKRNKQTKAQAKTPAAAAQSEVSAPLDVPANDTKGTGSDVEAVDDVLEQVESGAVVEEETEGQDEVVDEQVVSAPEAVLEMDEESVDAPETFVAIAVDAAAAETGDDVEETPVEEPIIDAISNITPEPITSAQVEAVIVEPEPVYEELVEEETVQYAAASPAPFEFPTLDSLPPSEQIEMVAGDESGLFETVSLSTALPDQHEAQGMDEMEAVPELSAAGPAEAVSLDPTPALSETSSTTPPTSTTPTPNRSLQSVPADLPPFSTASTSILEVEPVIIEPVVAAIVAPTVVRAKRGPSIMQKIISLTRQRDLPPKDRSEEVSLTLFIAHTTRPLI